MPPPPPDVPNTSEIAFVIPLKNPPNPPKNSGNPVIGLIVLEPPRFLSKFASAGVIWANNVSPFLPYFFKFFADFLMLFISEESTA